MPIKKYMGSVTHHIAYSGTTTYTCPHCGVMKDTEKIDIPIIDKRDGYEAALFNLPVLSLALVENTHNVEIDYVCEKCHLPIRLVRPLES